MEYIEKLIAYCKKNDIDFVAVTTPIPIATLKDYSDNYNAAWKYFGKFFEELAVGSFWFIVFTVTVIAVAIWHGSGQNLLQTVVVLLFIPFQRGK